MDASSFLFDFTELDYTRATSIVEKFLSNLHSNGFKDELLLQNWMSFSCDRAPNILGRRRCCVECCKKYPNLIVWHCTNHCLEIALNDAVQKMAAVYHMKTYFDTMYTVESTSYTNRAKLEMVALQCCTRLNSVRCVLGTC
jgi:hypothetical protein